MTEYIQDILRIKVAKIHEISDLIMKESYPLCRDTDIDILTTGQMINSKAYQIKCLSEQISGLLRSPKQD